MAAPANGPWLEATASRQFPAWLAEQNVSLALMMYQTGKLILIGRHDGRIAVFERTFNRCTGLWADGQTLWMNSLYQLWHFENVLQPGCLYNGHDRPYVPRLSCEIDEAEWAKLYSTKCLPFDPPTKGKIAVKVINHYGDEVLKVFRAS